MHSILNACAASAEAEKEPNLQSRVKLDQTAVPLSWATRVRIRVATPTSIGMAACAGSLSGPIGAVRSDPRSGDVHEPHQLRIRKTDRLAGSPVSSGHPDHEQTRRCGFERVGSVSQASWS